MNKSFPLNTAITIIKKYWFSEENNIFNNHVDALFGSVALIIIPFVSIILVANVDKCMFWNYTFPLISISIAGLYDTYGRYDYKASKNVKLSIRVALNFIALFFSGLCYGIEKEIISYLPPVFLFFSGILLIVEVYNRIVVAIKLSKWNMYV